jgi:hypothetical protein
MICRPPSFELVVATIVERRGRRAAKGSTAVRGKLAGKRGDKNPGPPSFPAGTAMILCEGFPRATRTSGAHGVGEWSRIQDEARATDLVAHPSSQGAMRWTKFAAPPPLTTPARTHESAVLLCVAQPAAQRHPDRLGHCSSCSPSHRLPSHHPSPTRPPTTTSLRAGRERRCAAGGTD